MLNRLNKPQINRKRNLCKKIKPLKTLINKDFSTILFGAEGETRQGFALSLLRKIILYVRAPLPDGKPSHMDEEFSSLQYK